ncbi:hypothetical protein CSUI_006511 [Cystoisospora suis]|uniref:Uncharacterized protein n=1 Tax=Cystoisospora suis TaxID=483139 RepID=A0A2C6KGN8_9APIC|nr:hypothetical protein CSUI_006511 [Cystoisospora suis]
MIPEVAFHFEGRTLCTRAFCSSDIVYLFATFVRQFEWVVEAVLVRECRTRTAHLVGRHRESIRYSISGICIAHDRTAVSRMISQWR